jgi:hypothetical protein
LLALQLLQAVLGAGGSGEDAEGNTQHGKSSDNGNYNISRHDLKNSP